MFKLLPCLLRLCLASNPLVCTCHKKRQGLLLQHVRQVVHLCEFETRVIFLSLDYKGQRSHLKSFPLLLLRRPTLWNTCLNTQWWNTWCLITPLITGQTLPPSLYGSPSSEPFTRLLPFCLLWHRHFGPLMNHTARYWDPKKCARLPVFCDEVLFYWVYPPVLPCWPDSIIGGIQRWFLSTFRPENHRPKISFFYVTSQEKKCSRQLHGKPF